MQNNETPNDNMDTSSFNDFICNHLPGLDDSETLIDHETVHPLVLDVWVELDKAGQVEVSNLEVQTMQCTATELLNRFMPSLTVFDAGNPATGREPRYIISADQVFQLISDTQMITYYTTKRVPAAWEAKYGQPPID